MVLMLIYPGPPLLIPEEWFEATKKEFYYIWSGQHYVPRPPDPIRTWFWGQAALLYFGGIGLYLILALPDVVNVAWRAASDKLSAHRSARNHGKSTAAVDIISLLSAIAVAFIGSLLAELWAHGRRST